MPKPLQELAPISEAAAAEAKRSGRMLMQFITPGWGSSGYYSKTVLESAAKDRVIPAGTHMYADHPTAAEDHERPVRSVKDLMAVTTEDARLGDGGALIGEVQVVPQWRELVETVKDAIGVSIRGSATDIVEGEAEGKRGGIIEGLVAPVMSVDFVTRAGRGGRVLSVLESAAANQRALEHDGVSEATVNDTREALQNVLRDTYGGDKTYVWVRDFDDTTVWFEVEDSQGSGLYAQGYTQAANGAVEMVGEWTEVRVVTSYVPVDPAATTESVPAARSDSTTTTQESKEDTMPQIEEARLRELEEAHGRVPTLESERDQARAENAQLRAREGARTRARARVTEANATLAGPVVDRIVDAAMAGDLPLTESGSLDEAAFDTRVDNARTSEEAYLTSLTESAGAGQNPLSGFGASTKSNEAAESARPAKSPWGRDLSVKGA